MMLGVSHAQRPPRQRLSSNALVFTNPPAVPAKSGHVAHSSPAGGLDWA